MPVFSFECKEKDDDPSNIELCLDQEPSGLAFIKKTICCSHEYLEQVVSHF
jgi:hypothetical protein